MENKFADVIENVMDKLKELVETETIIGKPIPINKNTIIIPISKASFGFALGGADGNNEKQNFQLGSGAGVNLTPMGFLVVDENETKMLEFNNGNKFDNIINTLPDIYNKFMNILKKEKNRNKNKHKNENESGINDEDNTEK